jgi:hypothetical protein
MKKPSRVKKIKKLYNKEEKRHDKAYEKENSKHEKRHSVELDEALKVGTRVSKKTRVSKRK